jgi:hypothetical protein
LRSQRLRSARGLDHQIGRFQPEGTGCIEDARRRKPQSGVPDRSIHQVNESSAIDIRKPRMRGERRRKAGTELLIQRFQPQRPAKNLIAGAAGLAAQEGVDGDLRSCGTAGRRRIGSRTRH